MILIEEVSRNWEREGEWRIAHAGLAWLADQADKAALPVAADCVEVAA